MSSSPRHLLHRAKRIVIKLGSRLVAESPAARPALIADEVVQLGAQGVQVVIVSSGAIALGLDTLGVAQRPTDLSELQAAAAVGQTRLMQQWQHAFSAHRGIVAQVLLTHADLAERARFLNARHTLRHLLDRGVVPIINENDTVATEEIRFGDNDQLAALVCNLVSADALVILTDVEGVRDASGQRMPVVDDIEAQAEPVAGGTVAGGVGRGGMASKVQSAKLVTRTGVPAVVAPGREPRILQRLVHGDDVGTLFLPGDEVLSSRKHWIAYGKALTGSVVIDAGAEQAVTREGKSLLAKGILAVEGDFAEGDTIAVKAHHGREVARGLTAFSADDLRRVAGHHSAQFESLLGHTAVSEVIHRDDLALV